MALRVGAILLFASVLVALPTTPVIPATLSVQETLGTIGFDVIGS